VPRQANHDDARRDEERTSAPNKQQTTVAMVISQQEALAEGRVRRLIDIARSYAVSHSAS
jgi:hypothetical protein